MAEVIYHRRDRWPPTKPIGPPAIESSWKGPGGYFYRIRLPRLAKPVRVRTLFVEVDFPGVMALFHSPQSFKIEDSSEEATNEAAVGYYDVLCPLGATITMYVVDWNKRGKSPSSDPLIFTVPSTLAPDKPGKVTVLKFEEVW